MNIEQVVNEMTLDEKLTFLTGKDFWGTVELERLSVPRVTVSDGPHGLRKVLEGGDGIEQKQCEAVAFPTYSALAATWNPALAREMGAALAGECIDHEVDVILGPGTNLKRTPLCGRNFEYFSEDPYLSGEFAAAVIEGVQSRGVGTSLKHFAGNNQEVDRFWVSSEIDMRTLRELYLPAFETAVKRAKPWTVMCSYNRLNGVHASQNSWLLQTLLREEWGYDGIVVSDWGAVHDRAESLKASLELAMPYEASHFDNLKAAYEAGTLSDEEIDGAVRRLLGLVARVEAAKPLREAVQDTKEERYALSLDIAREAITLLKNEDQVLPIRKAAVKKLAVIGSFAKKPVIQGGGSARVTPWRVISPYDELVRLAGDEIEVTYAEAYAYWQWVVVGEMKNVGQALTAAYDADMVLLFVGDQDKTETECVDRHTMRLQSEIESLILQTAKKNPNTVVVLQTGAAVDMTPWIDKVKGVVQSWYTGGAGGTALAEVIFGLVNPSGKLAETFPLCIEDTPAFGNYPGDGTVVWYQEGPFVGYRHYDKYEKPVLYPFGYGLSYTTFAYSELCLLANGAPIEPQTAWTPDMPLTVRFRIKNTGDVAGKEIAQVYVRDVQANVLRPVKELKGFCKVSLQPKEETEVSVTLDRRAFAFYSVNTNDWEVEKGAFEILVGASSQDIRLVGKLTYR